MTLPRGNWTTRNHLALQELLVQNRPGLAVFDWDNTCICGDIGESFLVYLLLHRAHRLSRSDLAGMVTEKLRGISRLTAGGNHYRMSDLRRLILTDPARAVVPLLLYNQGLEETPGIGLAFAYRWVTRLFKGLTRKEIDSLVTALLEEELPADIGPKQLRSEDGRLTFTWKKGLRVYEEMRDLIAALQDAGWRTVIVTASHPWIVEAMVSFCSYRVDRVLGMATRVNQGVLTRWADRAWAVNFGAGKSANIRRAYHDEPLLVAGDSNTDADMLTRFSTTRFRLLIDRGVRGQVDRIRAAALRGEEEFYRQPVDVQQGRFIGVAAI